MNLNRISIAFAAGSAGGLATVLTIWLAVLVGITTSFGVKLPSPLLADVYRMIVWGGIFGFLFLLPIMRGSIVLRGVLFGLAPSVVQCFIVFPYLLGAGMLGMKLGQLTPVLVLVFNTVWGLVTAFLFVRAGGDR